jgi:hypothetical protein
MSQPPTGLVALVEAAKPKVRVWQNGRLVGQYAVRYPDPGELLHAEDTRHGWRKCVACGQDWPCASSGSFEQ